MHDEESLWEVPRREEAEDSKDQEGKHHSRNQGNKHWSKLRRTDRYREDPRIQVCEI